MHECCLRLRRADQGVRLRKRWQVSSRFIEPCIRARIAWGAPMVHDRPLGLGKGEQGWAPS